MGVTCHLPRCRTRHPEGGVAPTTAAPSGTASPVLRPWVQPQRGQRHAEPATCPSEWRSRVHPPPMSDGHSPIGTHPGWLAFKTDGSATRLG